MSSLTTAFPNNDSKPAAVVEVICLFIVGMTYCWSNGPIAPAIASEIFPQEVRDKAFGISLLGQTACLLAITQPWPKFNTEVGGKSYWLLFGLNSLCLVRRAAESTCNSSNIFIALCRFHSSRDQRSFPGAHGQDHWRGRCGRRWRGCRRRRENGGAGLLAPGACGGKKPHGFQGRWQEHFGERRHESLIFLSNGCVGSCGSDLCIRKTPNQFVFRVTILALFPLSTAQTDRTRIALKQSWWVQLEYQHDYITCVPNYLQGTVVFPRPRHQCWDLHDGYPVFPRPQLQLLRPEFCCDMSFSTSCNLLKSKLPSRWNRRCIVIRDWTSHGTRQKWRAGECTALGDRDAWRQHRQPHARTEQAPAT